MTIVTCLLVFVVAVDLVVTKVNEKGWVVKIVDVGRVVADEITALEVIEVSVVVDADPRFALG